MRWKILFILLFGGTLAGILYLAINPQMQKKIIQNFPIPPNGGFSNGTSSKNNGGFLNETSSKNETRNGTIKIRGSSTSGAPLPGNEGNNIDKNNDFSNKISKDPENGEDLEEKLLKCISGKECESGESDNDINKIINPIENKLIQCVKNC